jgi:hypothetical protein
MTPAALFLPQLYAMRVLIDGLITSLEQEVRSDQPDDGSCRHPPERQVDATTLGGSPQVLCLVCGQQRLGTMATQ